MPLNFEVSTVDTSEGSPVDTSPISILSLLSKTALKSGSFITISIGGVGEVGFPGVFLAGMLSKTGALAKVEFELLGFGPGHPHAILCHYFPLLAVTRWQSMGVPQCSVRLTSAHTISALPLSRRSDL